MLAALCWFAPVVAQVSSSPSGYGAAPSVEVGPQGGQAAAGSRGYRAGPPVQFAVTVDETLTDNVGLDPSSTRRSDLISRISPSMRVFYGGAHSSLEGDVSIPILLYARTGSENNRIVPQVALVGHVDALDRHVFLDADARVSQSYLSPFAPTSSAIENNPNNAYTYQTYRLTPSVAHSSGDYSYQLRDDNTWTVASNAPNIVSNAYTNEVSGFLSRIPHPMGWSLEYRRTDVEFGDQPAQLTEISRARALWRPTSELEVFASAGYEKEQYTFVSQQGFIYGVGGRWRPSQRTSLDASWEHRFFGSAYHVTFTSRTPLTVWSLEASRDVTTYAQSLGTLPAGDVAAELSSLFSSRIPDPAERSSFVQQFMQARGLPPTLTDAINVYSPRARLEERFGASAGLIGARNAILLRVYRVRTDALAGDDLSEIIAGLPPNSTQVGGGVVWTYRINPKLRLATSLDQRYASGEASIASDTSAAIYSRQFSMSSALTYSVTPATSVHGGVRYQRQRSDLGNGYDESALFVGVTHIFR
jgi:uncharacterized protein (PEP-CTERM system associated)